MSGGYSEKSERKRGTKWQRKTDCCRPGFNPCIPDLRFVAYIQYSIHTWFIVGGTLWQNSYLLKCLISYDCSQLTCHCSKTCGSSVAVTMHIDAVWFGSLGLIFRNHTGPPQPSLKLCQHITKANNLINTLKTKNCPLRVHKIRSSLMDVVDAFERVKPKPKLQQRVLQCSMCNNMLFRFEHLHQLFISPNTAWLYSKCF